jgi:hypothetical protein
MLRGAELGVHSGMWILGRGSLLEEPSPYVLDRLFCGIQTWRYRLYGDTRGSDIHRTQTPPPGLGDSSPKSLFRSIPPSWLNLISIRRASSQVSSCDLNLHLNPSSARVKVALAAQHIHGPPTHKCLCGGTCTSATSKTVWKPGHEQCFQQLGQPR